MKRSCEGVMQAKLYAEKLKLETTYATTAKEFTAFA